MPNTRSGATWSARRISRCRSKQTDTRDIMSHQVHLVGSVPLPDARAVFSTVSAALGAHLKYISDSETGERLDWITWLEPVFARHPAFEPSGETFQLHGALARKDKRYRLKPGASIADVL